MLLNYFKRALRNIGRQKFYAFISITGLTIGLVINLSGLLSGTTVNTFIQDSSCYKDISK